MSKHTAYLVVDIETVADGRLIQRIRYPEADDLTPAEAVQRYRQQLMEERGSDFIPHTFQVPVSVAIAKLDPGYRLQELVTLDRPRFRPQVLTRLFWQGWEHYGQPVLVTFNGRSFDLPVLEMAAYRYGLALPAWFRCGVKPWEDPRNRYHSSAHCDLQEVLTNFAAVRQSGGLDLCASLLGKPGKLDTKGAMVQDLWEAGEHLRIDDYCMCDVLDTYFVFLRVLLLQGRLDLEQERERVLDARDRIAELSADNATLATYLEHFRLWEPVADDGYPFLPEADGA